MQRLLVKYASDDKRERERERESELSRMTETGVIS